MGIPIRELEQRGLMGATTASTTVTMGVGWQYDRPDFVPHPVGVGWQYDRPVPQPEESPPQLPQQPEEPPEVEELAGIDEYQPLRLETHESFSAKLRRRS